MKSIEFVSAQHVKVEFELATASQRVVSALLDVLTVMLYMLIIFIFFGVSDLHLTVGVEFFLVKLPWIFYYPIFEYFLRGQTLGKYIMGTRVVKVNGERPGLKEIFIRWLFKGHFIWIAFSFVSIQALFGQLWIFAMIHLAVGGMGFIYIGTSERRQRLGDMMAGTLIIKNKSSVKYSLRDVLSIKNKENYTPKYMDAIRFSDEDMLLIKNTIQRVRKYPNDATKKFAIELADESARLLGLEETPKKRMEFLQTLLQDYVVLTR